MAADPQALRRIATPKHHARARRNGLNDALRGWSKDLDGCPEYGEDEAYLEGYAEGEAIRSNQTGEPNA